MEEHGDGPKRQMKSPSQLQILEAAYQETPKPSHQMKVELARGTGLDYMQVQYWFGNRRYFDSHGPRIYKPRRDHDDPSGGGKSVQAAPALNPGTTSSMSPVPVSRPGQLLTAQSVQVASGFYPDSTSTTSLVTVARPRPLLTAQSAQVASEFNPDRTSSMSLVTVARAGPLLTGQSVQVAPKSDSERTSSMSPVPVATAVPLLTGSVSAWRHEPHPTFVPAGPSTAWPGMGLAMLLPLCMTQSHWSPVVQNLQSMVMHVENKLGHPLRADGPILGTKFKPLPPGAFGAPLEEKRDSQVMMVRKLREPSWFPIKASTFLPTLEYGSAMSLFNKTKCTVQDVHELNAEAPRPAHEYQFFPMQTNWLQKYENINQTHFPVFSVKTSNCEGQSLNEHAQVRSSFPLQCEISDTMHQSRQGGDKIISSVSEYHKAPNLLLTNNAPDDCHAAIPVTELAIPFGSSEKVTLGDASSYKMEKMQVSRSSGVKEIQQFDHARISVTAAMEEVNSKNCYQTMQNLRKRDWPCELRHYHDYDHYLVMPWKRSETTSMDGRQLSYFSDVGSSCRPLIAKWNRKESRAVYIVDDTDNTLSMSSGTDSTGSNGYEDEATENVKGHADSNPTEVINVGDEATEM